MLLECRGSPCPYLHSLRKFVAALGHSSVSRSTTISPLLVSNKTAMLKSTIYRVRGSADKHIHSHEAHAMLSNLLHCPALYVLRLATEQDFATTGFRSIERS